MTFETTVDDIRVQLREGRFPNEADVSNGVIMPILQGLDWPVFTVSVVAPQYPVESPSQHSAGSKTRVDFALCSPTNSKPLVFLEIKKVGTLSNFQEAGRALDQLMQYAFKSGVPIAVLTDGQEWEFYLPTKPGNYTQRQVYKLDLVERDISESCSQLRRYLAYSAVMQGIALSNAEADHQAGNRKSAIEKTLPEAWKKLLEVADESLVEVLSEKVEDLCGFKPDLEICAEFLSAIPGNTGGHHSPVQPNAPVSRGLPIQSQTHTVLGFTLHGQWYQCNSVAEVMSGVFERLNEADSDFLERFAALKKHGRKRRYVARNREELYPGRPDFCESHSIQLPSGWFMGTHYNRKVSLPAIIELACKVAGLEYGNHLVLHNGV